MCLAKKKTNVEEAYKKISTINVNVQVEWSVEMGKTYTSFFRASVRPVSTIQVNGRETF